MAEITENLVLVVDDSPEQIRYASQILKAEGCRVYAAANCTDAFRILKKKIPDLIILDIVMPKMDGFTFCSKIKSEPQTADIPIIFATAYNDKEYIQKSFAAGGSDYVVKPFIREELIERVKTRIRLARKNKQLQKAYAELDKFCYTVSHDIRSPLYVIKQLTGILTAEVEAGNNQEVLKICGMLNSKADQAAQMTESLHQFSKMFYEELQIELVDMDDLFQDVFDGLMLLEPERKIVFEKNRLGSVYADAALLRLVVQNVISNAIKFTREKAVARIYVGAAREGDKLIYTVSDNGSGFDEKYAEEVFYVFRKLHSDVEYEGDGIGLASVKRILLRHGGDAEIASREDEGTDVRIILPVT